MTTRGADGLEFVVVQPLLDRGIADADALREFAGSEPCLAGFEGLHDDTSLSESGRVSMRFHPIYASKLPP